MRMLFAALCMALSGCAYVSGPCSITAGAAEGNSVICETGGTIILIPASTLDIVRPEPVQQLPTTKGMTKTDL